MPHEPDFRESMECLCLASRKAARAITRHYERHLRAHGLHATQFSVLAVLAIGGPKAIGALAEALATERTTLTRNLALLEERGLVGSSAGHDARTRIVSITRKGREMLARAFPAWRKAQAALAGSIGPAAASSLKRLARSAQV
jgi:DNA-binding MarR family transcriptional regulator